MGRIVVSENISLDGVIQDPTGDEGFAFGGWFQRMSDERPVGVVRGRVPGGAGHPGLAHRPRHLHVVRTRWAERPGEWADRLRLIPKYVVSSTMDEATEWANSTILKGDVLEEVTALKERVDGDIVVYSSRRLVRTLLEHDLVDEVRLMTYPYRARRR